MTDTATTALDNGFRVVDIIRDPDGVIAVITERERDGRVSFSLAREYDVDGKPKRSAYLARRHLAAARRLLNDLEERLELAEDRTRAKRR
jgi:hypothetical protein